jgi:hypothetical protein
MTKAQLAERVSRPWLPRTAHSLPYPPSPPIAAALAAIAYGAAVHVRSAFFDSWASHSPLLECMNAYA